MCKEINAAADAAIAKYPNIFKTRGTLAHTAFRDILTALPKEGEYIVKAEVAYKGGRIVNPNMQSCIIIDAGIYDKAGNLIMVYDLKTGSAMMDVNRIVQISNELPNGGQNIHIFEDTSAALTFYR